jgi:uncharacterized protein involved in outer membrane biogenesis
MKLRRAFKIAAVVIAVPVLLLLLLLLYLNFADLSGWKDTVAGLLTETLGRKVEIHGAFETDIGFSTTLTAGGISLANAEWASETTMASIDHLEFEVRLLSLLSGPIDLQRLEVDGVRLLLEADGQGRGNWEFGTEDQDLGDTAPFELALGHRSRC